MNKPTFIISGGGTGGHIYPAIAIADELKAQFPAAQIIFVGAKDRMEMQKVPQAGYPIEGLWISGLQRKFDFKNLLLPLKVLSSLWKSYKLLRKYQPVAAIGTGGYASAALLKVAGSMGIPTLIQEQNSYPGITNKILSKTAKRVCVAYTGLEKFFPSPKIKITGNPIRKDILQMHSSSIGQEEAKAHFKLKNDRKVLLIIGGSLGARAINKLMAQKQAYFKSKNLSVLWQCGKFYYETYKSFGNDQVKVLAFVDRMDMAYAAADYIISRAGASSVSELALVGKPTIFIPSPNVAEDHQTKNAEAIVAENAALLIKEKNIETDFEQQFDSLLESSLLGAEMGQKFKALAKPNATKEIVSEIKKLIEG